MELFDQILMRHSFFEGMDPAYLELMSDRATFANFEKGEYVFHEGDAADSFYLILHGKVALEVFSQQKGPLAFQTAGEDEVLGWGWFYPPYRWHFDARVLENTRCIVLDGKWLRQACEENHDLGYEMLKRLGKVMLGRLQATRLQLLDMYGFQS
jgi:CRP-like cAMP-binding protein